MEHDPNTVAPTADSAASRWGGDGDGTDSSFLLLSRHGERCAGCQQVTWLEYLREHEGKKKCPDCHPAPLTPAMLSASERRRFDPTRGGEDGQAD